MIKIIVGMFLFISRIILSMEIEETKITKSLPPELKSRILLYFAAGLKEMSLEKTIERIKLTIKCESEMLKIFQEDAFFTENLIGILHRKFKTPEGEEMHPDCIAAKLGTAAGNSRLKYVYETNSKSFISFILSFLDRSPVGYGSTELLEFAKNNFKQEDIRQIITYQGQYGRTALMNAAFSFNIELVELILDLCTQFLSAEEKKAMINLKTRHRENALICVYFNFVNNPNLRSMAVKITDLLKKNGAEESDLLKSIIQNNSFTGL